MRTALLWYKRLIGGYVWSPMVLGHGNADIRLAATHPPRNDQEKEERLETVALPTKFTMSLRHAT